MKIIAEIGTSHCGDINKAREMIFAACESGADIIKFQWVYASEILHPDTGFVNLPGGKIPLYNRFKELEVSPDFFAECLEYTHKCKAKFLCSPFGLKSLSELVNIKPDMVKIASPELNHIPLLQKTSFLCSNIPLVLSSGVSTLGDIEKALNILYDGGIKKENLTLLHCSTFYPTPVEEYNVKLVKNLSAIFGIDCGISDHSTDPVLVPVLSAICGGTMVEKHFTLSNESEGLDDPVALTPEKFALMSHALNQTQALIERYKKEEIALKGGNTASCSKDIPQAAFDYTIKTLSQEYSPEVIKACLGDGIKKLGKSEKDNYGRTNRSLHYTASFKKGHVIKEGDIAVLRTEKILTPGIHPDFYNMTSGAKLTSDVKSGEGVQFKDFISY
ncbi:N-acetylneuraminate synthase family protein [Treponema sp.]|uniref:N-acetylneuraminate synthase family protein n=1 Tax=Treponema sp. TaxID=166 RepID=UPI0025DFA163|nr:N-acetylneuraminate synthase family protein [Treponema sp.]MCR5219228.1 N-acetylneuraminate synthase family protein [Treponema sp.]